MLWPFLKILLNRFEISKGDYLALELDTDENKKGRIRKNRGFCNL